MLYNFMDGIDRLAGVEVVSVCLLVWGLHYLERANDRWFAASVIERAAAMGFLLWNWPPARIFMGDGGSGFLGLMLGALMLLDAASEPRMLWVWLVCSVFVVDATWTLLHRWRLGIKLSEAHRTHAYQYASRAVESHLPVTLSVLVINLLWLAPIAALIARISGWYGRNCTSLCTIMLFGQTLQGWKTGMLLKFCP